MGDLLRIGAVACLEPEPERELRVWRRDLDRGEIDDPNETKARLDQYTSGALLLVRLQLFADVAESGGLVRYQGAEVGGCWMAHSIGAGDLEHAKELIRDNLELLQESLATQGVEASLELLESSRVDVMLADDIAPRLSAG